MMTTREIDKSKERNGNRDLSKTVDHAPTPYRGNVVSQWGHEPFRRMREEFDRVVDQFFGNWPGIWNGQGRQVHWGLDVQEDDANVTVRAEAPGFDPGDFSLEVRGDQLMVHGTHKVESQAQQGSQEWQQQEFYRSISLPQGIDNEQVEANYRNGILTVKLAKKEESKGRRITVKG